LSRSKQPAGVVWTRALKLAALIATLHFVGACLTAW
jgi:hypothetical protein